MFRLFPAVLVVVGLALIADQASGQVVITRPAPTVVVRPARTVVVPTRPRVVVVP